MTTSAPAWLRSSLLADDSNNPSASEALGLLAVAIWGGAVVCMVIRDIFKDRARSERGNEPDRQRWRERRHWIAGSRAIAEKHFVNRPAVALAAAGTENFDRGGTRG